MSDAVFPRSLVCEVFHELWRLLDPMPAIGRPHALCERLCAVGGYRRGKKEMKDLELLYVARKGERDNPEALFGEKIRVDLCDALFADLLIAGVLAKRMNCEGKVSSWGPTNKHAVHLASGLPIDIFATTAECWFNRLVVTTGPKASNVRIASLAKRDGWEWEAYGGGFVPIGEKWETSRIRKTMHSEDAVFEFVELKCPPPEERT